MNQGERIKEIRKALNLTLDKFGGKLGVGKTAISKIEKGENKRIAQLKELQKVNNEIIGWLEIEGTNINYPILQGHGYL